MVRKILPYTINICMASFIILFMMGNMVHGIYNETFPGKMDLDQYFGNMFKLSVFFVVMSGIAYFTKNKIVRFICLYLSIPLFCLYTIIWFMK